jgi:hypothetical protein
MKTRVAVAVLAACSVLAMATSVSAQFKGLKAMKKALETTVQTLEEPKPAPPASPAPPRSVPATPQGGYPRPVSSPPSVPVNRTEQPISSSRATEAEVAPIGSLESETKIQKLGPDLPRNLQVNSGVTPKFIQTSLSTVTSCYLGPPEGEDGRSYSFDMTYTPGTEIIRFEEFEFYKEGSWQSSKTTFKEVFQNIGILTDVEDVKISYAGLDYENYYFKFTFIGNNINYEINSYISKEWLESAPMINATFSNKWTLYCDNPENNG